MAKNPIELDGIYAPVTTKEVYTSRHMLCTWQNHEIRGENKDSTQRFEMWTESLCIGNRTSFEYRGNSTCIIDNRD